MNRLLAVVARVCFALVVTAMLLAVWYTTPVLVDRWYQLDNLERRAQIGETFGTSASLLSSLALVGVIATLVNQSRQLSIQRGELSETREDIRRSTDMGFRSLHAQLVSMALSNEELLSVWRYDSDGKEQEGLRRIRRELYSNLILSHVEASYVAGLATDSSLRLMLRELFGSPHIRNYWMTSSHGREEVDIGEDRDRVKTFVQIANEEARPYRHPGSNSSYS